ncbi:MAG: hypothetical protein RR413_07220 [Christensenellaceae bacterium]
MFDEQAVFDTNGELKAREFESNETTNMLSSIAPDATYRKKVEKDHKGYVANLVEAFDDQHSMITGILNGHTTLIQASGHRYNK